MIKRVIDIDSACYLRLQHQQLCIEQAGAEVARIPIEDVAVLVIHNRATYYTHALLSELMQANVGVVLCGSNHIPLAQVVPIAAHSTHTQTLLQQVEASNATKARLWQLIVQAKISEQAATLERNGKNAKTLMALLPTVDSGDSNNVEAQAARRYFRLLFGTAFRRDASAEGLNSVLNYGYSVVRAMCARAIVATGLHPALGVNHCNKYNPLCLADDIMEPLRPWVDDVVYKIATTHAVVTVNRDTKKRLLDLLSKKVSWQHKAQPLMVVSHFMAANLKQALCSNTPELSFPTRIDDAV